ncbi:MAG: hypothetical protein JO333_20575 [Verrucomicrobia bacterium]|nr:hypothetical protein [Verrucomicrobiota bacterium]
MTFSEFGHRAMLAFDESLGVGTYQKKKPVGKGRTRLLKLESPHNTRIARGQLSLSIEKFWDSLKRQCFGIEYNTVSNGTVFRLSEIGGIFPSNPAVKSVRIQHNTLKSAATTDTSETSLQR